MTSQPGDSGTQPDPSRGSGDQDSRAAGHADSTTTDTTVTDNVPRAAVPQEPADGSDLTAGNGNRWRQFPWRQRNARFPIRGSDGTAPGPGGPGNEPAAPSPDDTGAAGDSTKRTPASESTGPADDAAQANGFQAGATSPDPPGQHTGPPQNPGASLPRSERPVAKGGGAGRIPSAAGRQRRLSSRATRDRAVAALDAAASRRAVATAAADLLWTRPPEKPTRYRLPTRLTDMGHGWLDGRRGLPHLPENVPPDSSGESAPPTGEADSSGELAPLTGEAPVPSLLAHAAQTVPEARTPPAVEGFPPVAVPVRPPSWLQTPRMRVLWAQALELIQAEEEACIRDCSAYLSELRRFQKARDTVAKRHEQALAELARAQRPLSDPELLSRRLAEQSTQDRPDSLVRIRRQTAWERRLAKAARDANTATAQLADATREGELRHELRRDRMALAQAAAHCHYEFCMRRTATYLQQLVRTHKKGADLNMLLMRYKVGPELPEWTKTRNSSDETSSQ